MEKKQYYLSISIIRVISCIAILFYHLNLLKGGYLAVCTFFVLSSYLSCRSLFQKNSFSFRDYYWNRLKKIYFPLMIVTFLTIAIFSFFPVTNWLNLKPETTSIIFGYNNFWQLSANLDYFTRTISSPFIHFWYLSILLQFDFVFPFLFLILRKIGDKIHKMIPCILTLTFFLFSTIYFYVISKNQDIMVTYYHTLSRIFPLLFGVFLGFVHHYYDDALVPRVKKETKWFKFFFICYLLFLIFLFIIIDDTLTLMIPSMILVTLITGRLIDYGVIMKEDENSKISKIISIFSNMSYFLYLVQYPIIFFFQFIPLNEIVKLILLLLSIFVLSFFLSFCMNQHLKKKKIIYVRKFCLLIVLIISFYGMIQYVLAEDHTEEMKQLEMQLNQNEEMMLEKQKEYELKVQQESNDWNQKLEDLEKGEQELKKIVAQLPVMGIGDSVMLGAINELYEQFPNGYFDAAVSRTAWEGEDIIKNWSATRKLNGPMIFNLGTNGDCTDACKKEMIEMCGNQEIFWINVVNDDEVHFNSTLQSLAKKYKNIHIIDWNQISKGHKEYFIADGIHLTSEGKKVYAKTIYDSIYQFYFQKYQEKKEDAMKEHEEQEKQKITFYGNDLLLNTFDKLHSNFKDARFVIRKNFTFQMLKEEIELAKKNNHLTYQLVFAFDSSVSFTEKEIKELLELSSENKIYLLFLDQAMDSYMKKIKRENVVILSFLEKIEKHENYFMADKVHMTQAGNDALVLFLNHAIMK